MNTMLARWGAQTLGLSVVSLLSLYGCGDDSTSRSYTPAVVSDGVIFSYPFDGQTDVNLGTRFYVTFSKAVNESALAEPCSVDGGGQVSGNFCLVGPADSIVTISPLVEGAVIRFETDQLRQGTAYSLYVRGALIGGANNLPEVAPLLRFVTSQYDPIVNQAPTVTAINGENPAVYGTASTTAAKHPFMDFATLRVEFSEPLNEQTVVNETSGFQFLELNGSNEIPVAGSLLVRERHLSFDPDQDLKPGTTYRLRLNSAIRDRNGTALNPVSYDLVPLDSNTCGCLIEQRFTTTASFEAATFPQTSRITGAALNSIDLYSTLIGANSIYLRDSTLQATLADPSHFSGLIPFVIRKGAALDISGLDLQLAGTIPANLQTGNISARFVTDVTGFLDRNVFHSADTLPDDQSSPLSVYLSFDLALSGEDDNGNAVFNQTIPHVQATGTAYIDNGNLYIESVRSLELNLLGLQRVPAHLVLGIHSVLDKPVAQDTDVPKLVASYPADGAVEVDPAEEFSLLFSEPMDSDAVTSLGLISLVDASNGNAEVPFQLHWDGSSILIRPSAALINGHQYQLSLGALRDLAGNELSLSAEDASGGDGHIVFTTDHPATTNVGPMVSAVVGGRACTLTDNRYSVPGRCAGGKNTDDGYSPLDVSADSALEMYFTQPMQAASLTLASTCNTGSIRVEKVDESGSCSEAVAGTLITATRSAKFIPHQPWVAGNLYRLTLVAGANASCNSGEICGANNRPLNPDPLNGAVAADAGGGNIVSVFKAVGADTAVHLPLRVEPFTDRNGNGYVEGGEFAHGENSAQVVIPSGGSGSGYGGIVTDAKIVGSDRIYLGGALPVAIGEAEPLTVDGALWNMTTAGDSQIPVRVTSGVLYGTSLTMSSKASLAGIPIAIDDTKTGINILRLRESGGAPVRGYIVQEAGVEAPQFIGQFDFYMDAPDMQIQVDIPLLGGLIAINHDLHSKPLSARLKGPAHFLADGRIVIDQTNAEDIQLRIEIAPAILPSQRGYINLKIPAGAMQLRLTGNPIKGRH